MLDVGMQNKPLVSFIMSVYNTKEFKDLDRSIESILNQTYENCELIICDDCSTNGVYEYLIENYSNNPRVTIIRNIKNSGCAYSPNHALQYSNGDYIARQDDDDYSANDRIEKQMDFLLKNEDYAFVSAGLSKFDKDGVWSTYIPKEKPSKRDFRFTNQFPHAVSLFRRNCLEQINGYRVSNETRRCEDYDLFMRLYAAGFKGYNIQESLYFYNYPRDNSKKGSYKNRINESIIRRKGFRALNLPFFDYFFVLKPLIVGLFPEPFVNHIKGILQR